MSTPPPPTKVTIVGTNDIYKRDNVIGPFLVHKRLGPRPPPPFLSSDVSLPQGFGRGTSSSGVRCRTAELRDHILRGSRRGGGGADASSHPPSGNVLLAGDHIRATHQTNASVLGADATALLQSGGVYLHLSPCGLDLEVQPMLGATLVTALALSSSTYSEVVPGPCASADPSTPPLCSSL